MAEAKPIIIPRDVLLVEIGRRCCFVDCDSRISIGLTKNEAIGYKGFECEHCKRWNDDELTLKDIPDWWDEIQTLRKAN